MTQFMCTYVISKRCAETLRAAAEEKQRLVVQLTDVKKQLELVRLDSESRGMELLRVQKVSGISEENQRLEVAALQDRCQRLNAMLEAESAVRKLNEDKAGKYEMAEDELLKLRKEVRVFVYLFVYLLRPEILQRLMSVSKPLPYIFKKTFKLRS